MLISITHSGGVDDGKQRGEIELAVHWTFNSQKSEKKKSRFLKWLLRESDEESGDDVPDQVSVLYISL
jgi:hypothetical protein